MSREKGKIAIDTSRCKGCGLCTTVCPQHNITLSESADSRGIRVACFDRPHDCTGCRFCYIVCPDTAITVFRKKKKKDK